jgi:hypothetical protein
MDTHDDDAIDDLLATEPPEPDDEDLWHLYQEELAQAAHEQARYTEHERRETLANAAEHMLSILVDLTSEVRCQNDHHGHCQTHGWAQTISTCPHGRAQELLAQINLNTEAANRCRRISARP